MSRLQPLQVTAVLFDLDGTLVDTAPDMVGAVNDLRHELGLPPAPYDIVRESVSKGGAGVIRAAWGTGMEAPVAEQIDRFLEIYAARITQGSRLFNGMARVLDRIEAIGWPWGVVTNKNTQLSEALLTGLGLRPRMATLVCGDTLETRKPDPAGLELACRQAGVPTARCVYVGDDERDIVAGRAAGCPTVAAAYGYVPAGENCADWNADVTIHSAAELLQVLGLEGIEAAL